MGLGIGCSKVLVCGISPLMERLEVRLGISCGKVAVCGMSPLTQRCWWITIRAVLLFPVLLFGQRLQVSDRRRLEVFLHVRL